MRLRKISIVLLGIFFILINSGLVFSFDNCVALCADRPQTYSGCRGSHQGWYCDGPTSCVCEFVFVDGVCIARNPPGSDGINCENGEDNYCYNTNVYKGGSCNVESGKCEGGNLVRECPSCEGERIGDITPFVFDEIISYGDNCDAYIGECKDPPPFTRGDYCGAGVLKEIYCTGISRSFDYVDIVCSDYDGVNCADCGTGIDSCAINEYSCTGGYCNPTPIHDLDEDKSYCDLCSNTFWAKGGEEFGFGEYEQGDEVECCKDDSGEYYRTNPQAGKTACCAQGHLCLDGVGQCQLGIEDSAHGNCDDEIDNDCDDGQPRGGVDCEDSSCFSDPLCGGCECGEWMNVGCGVSPCSSTKMKQERECIDNCDIEEQCVYDASCQECQLTSANWNAIEVVEGTVVKLIVEGTNCDGAEVSFEILEEDNGLCSDDNVDRNPMPVIFDGRAEGEWVAEWQADNDDGLFCLSVEEPPEFYFKAEIEPENRIESKEYPNGLLEVTQGQGQYCDDIFYCDDYPDQIPCDNDLCGVVKNSVPPGISCDDPDTICNCTWEEGRTPYPCQAEVTILENGNEIGTCVSEGDTDDDCNDGFLDYWWDATWTWHPDNTYYKDNTCGGNCPNCIEDPPLSSYWHCDSEKRADCVSGGNTIPCSGQIRLPFFGIYNVLGVLIVIALIYFLMNYSGKKKKK